MQRGIVSFTNPELKLLHELATTQGCKKKDLLAKLTPVEEKNPTSNKTYDVLVSEDEAEIILDCMPMPSKDDDPNLVNSRIKVQQFLAKTRFPESSS